MAVKKVFEHLSPQELSQRRTLTQSASAPFNTRGRYHTNISHSFPVLKEAFLLVIPV
jgi:hypothetical protein